MSGKSSSERDGMKVSPFVLQIDIIAVLWKRSESGRIKRRSMHACARKIERPSNEYRVPLGQEGINPVEISPATVEAGSTFRKMGRVTWFLPHRAFIYYDADSYYFELACTFNKSAGIGLVRKYDYI